MGALPKATDSHAENKRKLRDEVQGESTGRIYSNSKDVQERNLQSWMNQLEKVAQEEERTRKTVSLKIAKLGTRSSSQSQNRSRWRVTGKTDANSADDKRKKIKGSWEDENRFVRSLDRFHSISFIGRKTSTRICVVRGEVNEKTADIQARSSMARTLEENGKKCQT